MAGSSRPAALVIVLLLAGCATKEDDGGAAGLAKGASWEEQRQAARAVLARYDASLAGARAPGAGPSAANSAVVSSGLSIDSATLDARGTRMTVSFIGSPEPATQPCGIDYAAEPIESDRAATVIVLEQPNGGGSGTCALIGASRTAVLNLARPLGDRAVLDIQGEPVPVTRTAGTK
ncbi:hypothetical protein ACTOB_001510 [Actinoplanes oblitus]|uniref:Uncharacterized protein n=1 Tax=Actinoplanes oblitus TaxID=3040509 RepID=A0ABY8WJW6_9ACTN|nr:hypothetical protein [Actinoplanes oblitus]WIM97943.1 hypothetical protein ACTOB_001510 [Actinoplanes oblitus]